MYKIMIIDDNHISVDGICHNIGWSDLNAEVVCKAYDGQQALNYLQNNPVDLIIWKKSFVMRLICSIKSRRILQS